MYLCAVCQSEKHKPLIWRLYCMRQNVWETLMQLFHLQFLLSYVIYSFIFLAVIFKHQADLKICLAWWRTCHKPWWEVAETQHYSYIKHLSELQISTLHFTTSDVCVRIIVIFISRLKNMFCVMYFIIAWNLFLSLYSKLSVKIDQSLLFLSRLLKKGIFDAAVYLLWWMSKHIFSRWKDFIDIFKIRSHT